MAEDTWEPGPRKQHPEKPSAVWEGAWSPMGECRLEEATCLSVCVGWVALGAGAAF